MLALLSPDAHAPDKIDLPTEFIVSIALIPVDIISSGYTRE